MMIWGVYRERVTPVPIPNTEVKPLIGDDTARVASWESSTMPHYILPGYELGYTNRNRVFIFND